MGAGIGTDVTKKGKSGWVDGGFPFATLTWKKPGKKRDCIIQCDIPLRNGIKDKKGWGRTINYEKHMGKKKK